MKRKHETCYLKGNSPRKGGNIRGVGAGWKGKMRGKRSHHAKKGRIFYDSNVCTIRGTERERVRKSS